MSLFRDVESRTNPKYSSACQRQRSVSHMAVVFINSGARKESEFCIHPEILTSSISNSFQIPDASFNATPVVLNAIYMGESTGYTVFCRPDTRSGLSLYLILRLRRIMRLTAPSIAFSLNRYLLIVWFMFIIEDFTEEYGWWSTFCLITASFQI
jgi:hypothetical protein